MTPDPAPGSEEPASQPKSPSPGDQSGIPPENVILSGAKDPDSSVAPRAQNDTTNKSDTFNLSGDFRGAVVNIQSTIVGAAEVKDIESLAPEPGDPPYQGLQYFEEKDAGMFFGRELLTAKLAGRLAQSRFLAVIGASGSGKSSLVRAGLVPALRRGGRLADDSLPPPASPQWEIRVLTPTAHPLDALAAALASDAASAGAVASLSKDLAASPRTLVLAARQLLARLGKPRLFLVIDQFEELFVQCHSQEERHAFIDNLLGAVDPQDDQPVAALILLRADFYAQLAQSDRLRELVSQQQEFIGAMSRDELVRAIIQPAALGRWKIQEGLVELMLDDAGSEPGALPLLSHALLETWMRRRGRTMTLSGYTECGGVRGAIAQTAETVFRQRLTPEQQPIARMIFIRLAELGDDSQDTRRRASFSELITRSTDAKTIDLVLSILTDARLVTTSTLEPGDVQVVEVAHEALIREWPTLRQWLSENRAGLILHRQLADDTNTWLGLKRDPGALYRGLRLTQAGAWAEQNSAMLSLTEQEFLDTSRQVAAAETRLQWLRRLIFPVAGVVLLGLLTVLFFLTGLNYRFRTPAKMTGVYNIAVAEFGTLGADGRVGPASNGAGTNIAGWITSQLQSELASDHDLLVWHDSSALRPLNVSIGRVEGAAPAERIAAAQAMAARLNAQMVIFGSIDPRTTPPQLVLETWIVPQLNYQFEDILGSYQAGQPIPLANPANPGLEARPEINRQASTLAWLALGLTHTRFGQTQEALHAYQKAASFSPQSQYVQFFIGREALFQSDQDSAHQAELTRTAEQAFQQANALDPHYPRAYIGLGSVYFAEAKRLVASVQAASPAASNGPASLKQAGGLIDQAIAAYSQALNLPASAAQSGGIPSDLTARLGMATCLRLKGEIQARSGQADSAAVTLQQSAQALESLVQPFQAAKLERYLAQTYQTLGTAYQFLGALDDIKKDFTQSKAHYTLAAKDYDQCTALGKTSLDSIVKTDIAEKLCVPFRKAVQDRLDVLAGGS